ncbi:hypothetical protein ACSLBF_16810 [Pseudoalteromonas sp. T1lg65]|uniref:hypothetical protein n=1 Tax=Pseudoalteromonas sp. T1lg65 TaxID=2077101 RepID=UPI003F79A879
MGWFSSKKQSEPIEVYRKYKRNSKITSSHYIDPDGYEYGRECVGCHDCIFRTRGGPMTNGCKIYNKPDLEMIPITRNVIADKYCDFFLDRSFDDADAALQELK